MEFKPFEDEEEVKKIEKKRDDMIESLSLFDLSEFERARILREIKEISEKLLNKARYKGK